MNYDLNEDHKILKEAARKFLADEYPSEVVREMAEDENGFKTDIWEKMADMGWIGLLTPERYGGSDMDFNHLAILLAEMGFSCFSGPFFSTVVLGGLAVLEAGSEEQKKKILPDLAAGKRLMTLAWVEKDGLYTPNGIKLKTELKGDKYILTGTKLFVSDAHTANTIICAARTGDKESDISLFLVDAGSAGVNIEVLKTMSGDKQCEVAFNNVEIDKNNMLGKLNNGWPTLKKILLMAAVAKCAEMSGGAERIMDLTVTYAKDREQFGRVIGTFQAVQHHCANMMTYFETIKYITFQTAWRIGADLPFEKEASMCKAWASDSYRKMVALAHQVIGGMGFMEEYDLQLYFKHAKTAEIAFGDARFHRELVAQEMGL